MTTERGTFCKLIKVQSMLTVYTRQTTFLTILRNVITFLKIVKNFTTLEFHNYILNQREKCIQISTNMTSIS